MAKILELLSDGKWHTLDELREKAGVTESNIMRIIQFLKEYGFVMVDEEECKIRLDENAREFLAQAVMS